jgi:hypothetical protein
MLKTGYLMTNAFLDNLQTRFKKAPCASASTQSRIVFQILSKHKNTLFLRSIKPSLMQHTISSAATNRKSRISPL